MSRVVALPWADVDHLKWGEVAAFNVRKADLTAAGLTFELVDFDGLQVEVAAFQWRRVTSRSSVAGTTHPAFSASPSLPKQSRRQRTSWLLLASSSNGRSGSPCVDAATEVPGLLLSPRCGRLGQRVQLCETFTRLASMGALLRRRSISGSPTGCKPSEGCRDGRRVRRVPGCSCRRNL